MERADPEQILRSMMRQASDLPGGPPLHQTLKYRYSKHHVAGEVSIKEASEIIIDTIEFRSVTFILIDALDECDHEKRNELVDALKRIVTESQSLVKIFITSRDVHSDIVASMEGFPVLYMDVSRNQIDIALYVQYIVQRAISEKKLLPTGEVTKDVERRIMRSLCDGANGRYVHFVYC